MRPILIPTVSCAAIVLMAAGLPAADAPAEPGEFFRDGTLVNERGEPVRGALVEIFAGGLTDAEGRFRLDGSCNVRIDGLNVLGEITSTNPLVVKAHIDAAVIPGIWSVISLQNDGATQEPTEDLRVFIDRKRLTIRQNGKVVDHRAYSYALDAATSPGHIDLTRPDGMILGIYSWDKDRVTLCFNENGQERPTEFRSVANSRNDLLLILQRAPETQSLDSVPGIDTRENESLKQILTFEGRMDFPGNPLGDVMDYLREIHKIGVEADPAVNVDVEVEIDTTYGVNLHTALLMLLAPHDLQCVLRDGKIVVTPRPTD